LYYYDDRLSLYPEVIQTVRDLAKVKNFRERCRIVVLQATRSRYTRKLSRRMNEEIFRKSSNLNPASKKNWTLTKFLAKIPKRARILTGQKCSGDQRRCSKPWKN
jgi:hypothetical protein